MKKASDRILISAVALVGLLAAFWFLALGPKRDEASKLDRKVERLQGALAEQQQRVAAAEQARRDFPRDYTRTVILGKAVPSDHETASLLVELSGLATRAQVDFRALELAASSAAAPIATPPAPGEPTATAPVPEPGQPATTTTSSAPAPATEAVAATLPIGASVGPAGLPVLPYALTFKGDFFGVADFIRGIEDLVRLEGDRVVADGRLLTVDGFSLSQDTDEGFPHLVAKFAVTTFLTPSDQGATAGATPAGPAAVSAAPISTEVTP